MICDASVFGSCEFVAQFYMFILGLWGMVVLGLVLVQVLFAIYLKVRYKNKLLPALSGVVPTIIVGLIVACVAAIIL